MMKKLVCLVTGILWLFFADAQRIGFVPQETEISGPFMNSFEEELFDVGDTIQYTTPLSFCQGGSVLLTANTSIANPTFQWKKDGSDIPGATTSTFTANVSGSYSVTVGTVLYTAVTVTVFPKPVPVFTFNNNACSGVVMNFNSTVTSGTAPFTYSWNFGDGNTSTAVDPSHIFNSLGCGTQNYTVSLTVTDSKGCSSIISQTVSVLQKPDVQVKDPNNPFAPFSNCANSPTPQNPSYTITVANNSPSASCITSYSIDWGDGNIQNNISFPITHTYTQLGAYNMIVKATGSNGCYNTKTYVVANQSNPAGSLGTLGSTTNLCAPATIPFTITNWQLNSPGTSYILTFGDGQSVSLAHPLNANMTTDTVNHTYTTSSCPSPTYTAELQVVNACANTPYSAGNIQISTKPQANFTSALTVCAGQNICFNNTTIVGNYGPSCSGLTLYSWDFGDGTPVSDQENGCHTYTIPGNYTITLTASNPCGSTTFTRQICVVSTPVPAFTLDKDQGCGPLTVSATNISNTLSNCAAATYNWSITTTATSCGTGAWNFASGSNANSINPVILFSNAGIYNIKLSVTNACGTYSISKQITVKAKPSVTLNSHNTICQNQSIQPTAVVGNCYSNTPAIYSWSFVGGTPASSTATDPGPISYNNPGAYTVALTVTNECGSTTVTKPLTVAASPNVVVPSNKILCSGESTGPLNFSSALSGTVFSWTNNNTSIGLPASGNGSINSFTPVNNGAFPVIATITVTPSNNGCTGASQSFTITVNPRPSLPGVSSPVNYCQNAAAVPLTATASTGNSLLWYTVASGGTGSTTAPTPSTSTVGNIIYYVSQLNPSTGCEGQRAAITVNVKSSPQITNATAVNPTACNTATGSISLTGLSPNTNYTVQYTKNGNVQTLNIVSNNLGVVKILNLSSGTYTDIQLTLNGCNSNVVGPFSLSDPNPPATPVASGSGTYCSGSSIQLNASSATPGVIYSWSGPNGYTSNLQNPVINNAPVTAAGTYSVIASLNGCTSAAGTVSITINATPALPTVSSNAPLCSGNNLEFSANTTTANASYSWTGPNGFTSSLQNPTITNAGTAVSGNYQVTATSAVGNCSSAPASLNVVIKPTPKVTGTSFTHPTNCSSSTGTIVLNGLTANTSYVVNYEKNGVPVTSNISAASTGSLTITNLAAGTYTNIRVNLNNCLSNIVGPFTLTDPNPPASPVVESNGPVCSGASLQLNASTSSTGNAVYTWTGPGGFTSSQQNPVIPNATTGASGSYSVTVSINGCSSNGSVNATVNPKPAKPAVVRPVLYCLDGNASALQATAATGNELTWYDNENLLNGSPNAFIPATANAGQFFFYVTQTNSFGCTGDTAKIPVIVYTAISSNSIGTNQAICSGNTPTAITPVSSPAGGNGSYTYQWQSSTDNGANWTNIAGATNANFSPGPLFEPTRFRRIVNSGPCSNHISNEVLIDVNGTLANYGIGEPQTICAGTTPSLLNGQAPTGGNGSYTFQWQSSTDNSNWTDIAGATVQDYQPSSLMTTTYYRRKLASGPCSVLSPSIAITVNPVPVLNAIPNQVYCNNTTVPSIIFGSDLSTNTSYTWTNDNVSTGLTAIGTGNIASFTSVNNSIPKLPVSSIISVIPVYTSNNISCAGNAGSFTLTVLPNISMEPIADTVVCTGSTIPSYTPIHDAGTYSGSTVSYKWFVTGSGTSLAAGSGAALPLFTTHNPGTNDLVSTITITPVYFFGGKSCDGVPEIFTVTVKPATPSSGAGPDTVLCAATTYTMSALSVSGTTGLWTQIAGTPVTITDPSLATTSITGLQQGMVYRFEWMITGFASCPSTRDTVTIEVKPELINTIETLEHTICSGQSVTIDGHLPSGGNGIYQYQWQSSIDGNNWSDLPGYNSEGITYTPSQSVYLRRNVFSTPCENASLAVHVIVQPPVSNNTISANQSICINTAASMLIGSSPSGANGLFFYQWQSSTDNGITWQEVAGATNQDLDPGVLTQTTKFRRKVFSNLCSGPQSSTSNEVVVTVNPDAQALFTVTKDSSCAPFLIDNTVILLQPFPDRNLDYFWYANGNFIGQGSSFPGYSLLNSQDSVVIELVAVSSFGCLNDSIESKFYTYQEPQPSFVLSDTVDCGPLTVTITNTTPHEELFQYHWNFGNGQTSTQAQPGMVVFPPNPNFGDTTYLVKLTVISQCNTYQVADSVRVKSKPKALFSPDHSVGCSPMTVTFNNNSAGIGNQYIWYFGDGSIPVTTQEAGSVSHTFHSGVQDTFYVKLVAVNECGSDSLSYAIVVSPNQVALDFAINGNQFSGCSPHSVQFINNSSGANHFTWNFGDNNIINTTDNIDTVFHTYQVPGTYIVTLTATNGCSDTTSTETIIVYPKPQSSYTADAYSACIGDSIVFTNQSSGATSYLWLFGDGSTSTLTNPVHHYSNPGLYSVSLISYNFNAPGTVCTDTLAQQVQVVSTLPGSFTVSDSVGYCAPFTVNFSNQHVPSVTAQWDFGDGSTGTGNHVTHTYLQAGMYQVTLVVKVPGGCTYTGNKTINVLGPQGSWTHSTGYVCNNQDAIFQVNASNADSLTYYFGDGSSIATTSNVMHYQYANPGIYFPRVVLKNNEGCEVMLDGLDSIKVDRINAGFSFSSQKMCGFTSVHFIDTSFAYFGKNEILWNFGDGNTATGAQVMHQYLASGVYPVQLIVKGNSGCSDTVMVMVDVHINNLPSAEISAVSESCQGYQVVFNSNIQSTDDVNFIQWNISNGVSNTNSGFSYTFSQTGNYTVRLVTGTVNGCYDTAWHSINVKSSPSVQAANDLVLCRGSSAPLSASGINVVQYNWMPLEGLSCYDCQNPIASPLQTTPYIVKATNVLGCSAYDTLVVTVIQPLNMNVTANDSICIGESSQLIASGAAAYSWSPAAGLSSTTISNPIATPQSTTVYRVVGYDGYNCFTDTAFVTVAVGLYPTVNLGPDLMLATGTMHPLTTVIQNGPVSIWEWSPSTDLSCNDCALPVAHIKKDIDYSVRITTPYGCSATDSIRIKTFCENAQVFIPNAFTPNNDGHNDMLMVRASGVAMVKSFRIFNRWGELVFEKSNFNPNDPQHGWDGRIRGVVGGPDVYVYTADVLCENGSSYTYKGNVTILK